MYLVSIGEYGWIFIFCNYNNENGESQIMKARLHAPIGKV